VSHQHAEGRLQPTLYPEFRISLNNSSTETFLIKNRITTMEQFKVIHYRVNKSDANKLVSWWNANTPYYYFKKKVGKLYNIVRQL
jgi:hypothetical protein